MVCQTYGLHAGRLPRKRQKSGRRQKRPISFAKPSLSLANSFATLNSQLFVWDLVARIRWRIFGVRQNLHSHSQPNRCDRGALRDAGVQTMGSPNKRFRNTQIFSGPLPPVFLSNLRNHNRIRRARTWRKPQESGMQTTGYPNNGLRKIDSRHPRALTWNMHWKPGKLLDFEMPMCSKPYLPFAKWNVATVPP